MVLDIIKGFDPILTTPTQPFDFNNPPFDPMQFAHDLVETMDKNNGIGLAANQVGVPYSIFCIRSDPFIVFFNPRIVHYSDNEIKLEEGCLSFPHVLLNIKRPSEIRVRFQYPNSEVKTEIFKGITSRVIQHEMDHLQGKLFMNHDSVTKYHREKALKKLK